MSAYKRRGFSHYSSALLRDVQALELIPWSMRRKLLRRTGMDISDGASIDAGAMFTSGNVTIGADTYINRHFLVDGLGKCRIGSGVRIGPGVKVIASVHDITDNPNARASTEVRYLPVTIEDGVWIGTGVIIMPGCTIGAGSVIGAGSIVTKDTQSHGLYVGVPARLMRQLPTKLVDA
jgi:maltose O-acetyltransferase